MATHQFSEQNFNREVLQNQGTVLVDVWAQWCPPCRALGPVIEELSNDYQGIATVGKLNLDQGQAIAQQFGITSIPTVLVFHNGQLKDRLVGLQNKHAYADAIEKAAA